MALAGVLTPDHDDRMDQTKIDALRGHKFLPASARDVPTLDDDFAGVSDEIVVHLRYFTNAGSAHWLVAQHDPEISQSSSSATASGRRRALGDVTR